jgi:uncharacterized protein YcfJ
MDKPAAAGEWDSSDTKAQRSTAQLSLPLLAVQVFDMPRDAQSFEATRTLDVTGPTGGKATISIALRRTGAAPAVAAAPMPAAAPSAKATAAPAAATTDRAKADCPPLAADGAAAAATAGADVGGKALGGGYGRQVGSAVGGILGALAGATKTAEPAAQDCPQASR